MLPDVPSAAHKWVTVAVYRPHARRHSRADCTVDLFFRLFHLTPRFGRP